MTRKPIVAAIIALAGTLAAPAAQAQNYGWNGYGSYGAPRYGYDRGYNRGYDRGYERGYDRSYDRGYPGGYDARGYDGRGYYETRYRPCRSGTTGAILGALAGGLLGRAIDDRGDHAIGTILGAGGGALAGRAVERSNNSGYCR